MDTFNKNIRGAMNRYSNVSRVLRSWGWSVGYVSNLLWQAAQYEYY